MASEIGPDRLQSLTDREREVLELLRLGLSDAEIAQRLDISRRGASKHISEIIGKLGVRNRYEAAAWPERPPWWVGALAPLALAWRRAGAALPMKASSLAAGVAGGVVLALVAGLMLVAVLLARGGTASTSERFVSGPISVEPAGLSQPPALSPPAATAPTPTATPDPLPQLDAMAGMPLYVKDGSLWLGLRASPPRPVMGSELGTFAGYAGAVRLSDSSYDAYYVQQTSVQRDPNGGSGGTAQLTVYREGIDGNGFQDVFRFEGRADESSGRVSDASISPDGRYLAFVDLEGLAIADLQAGSVTRLLDNYLDGPEPMAFYSYARPVWSPDGQRLAFQRYEYEEGWLVRAEPFRSPLVFHELGQGSGTGWAADGQRLCLWQSYGMDSARAAVYDVPTAAAEEVLPDLDPRSPAEAGGDIHGCAWADDGRLAFGYGPNGAEPPLSVAIIRDEGATIGSEALDHRGLIVAWLPDDSGVVLNRLDGGRPAVYRPGEGFFRLPPLLDDAEWLVGVIDCC